MNRQNFQVIRSEPNPIIGWNREVSRADPATLDRWLGDGDTFLVDVREPHEFETARIPGSFLVPMSRLDTAGFPRLPNMKTVLVCRAGARAIAVGDRLLETGRDDVFVLDGGLEAWTAAGFETED